MFKEYKKAITVAVIVLLVVIVGVTFVSWKYTTILIGNLREETDRSLSEKEHSTVKMLEMRLQNDIDILSGVALTISDPNDVSGQMDYLKQVVSKNEFEKILVINAEGNGIGTDDKNYACANMEYFTKGIVGESGVTEPIYNTSNNMVNVYYVPIMKNEEVIGVLSASYSTDVFQNSLDLSIMDGQGYGYIANDKGTLIACSDNTIIDPMANSVFDLTDSKATEDSLEIQKIIDKMTVGNDGTSQINSSNGKLYISFIPLNVNSWYLISVVPERVVTGRITYMVGYSLGMMSFILIVFICIFAYVITTLRKSSADLYKFAYTDTVTGYGNGNAFFRDLREILSKKVTRKLAIVHLDVDKFKYINDMYGYNTGDQTLKAIAEVLERETQRDIETHARLSNDFFGIVLTYVERENLVEKLDKIIETIEGMNQTGQLRFAITVNAGVYEIVDKTVDPSIMLDRANIAHRSVKENRFAKFAFYHDNMRDEILREKAIEDEMHDALAGGQFEVYYQPKYFVNSSTLGGAEALIRWNHPDKGLVPPNSFIPLFEKNGFVVQIDLFVFRQVCRDISVWIEKGYRVVPVSFNLSRVHFNEHNFMSEFRSIMQEYKVPSKYIEFEVTESTAIQNTEKLLAVLNEIHSMGCSVSMDDFGSGYSSLNMLKQIPVDVVKIDRDFFRDSSDNTRGKEIVASVVSLAKRLGIEVVAEGIEDKEQLEFLQTINCDLAQGYYFAKPLRKSDFEERLKEGERK